MSRSPAGDLNHGLVGHRLAAEDQGHPGHALAPHRGHLDGLAVGVPGDNGDDPFVGEPDVARRLAGGEHRLALDDFDHVQMRREQIEIPSGNAASNRLDAMRVSVFGDVDVGHSLPPHQVLERERGTCEGRDFQPPEPRGCPLAIRPYALVPPRCM